MLKVIRYSFYVLLFLTPLIWSPKNYELFEYNKMMFVYFITVIITTAWIIKMIREKKFLVKKTPLDIPLLLFLAANILSTIFSIDLHTSIWGYYSRSNGGLLSLISYLLLYYALVSNFVAKDIPKLLKIAILGGILVGLWAIPESKYTIKVSPSCLLLTGQATAGCWVQDVESRVFATLGQPNWLAAYMGMLIFPALYFFITEKKIISKIIFYLSLVIFYVAFTFTYSRGSTLGMIAGIGIFVAYFVYKFLMDKKQSKKITEGLGFLKPAILVLVTFALVNLAFGSAVTRFQLLTKSSTTRPTGASAATTQLESGGTESGQIRLIVWKGAIEIFKHYPLFGSGVETFAYSYYGFRPAEHNLVSEWDFLYNKAHNEYLNYLATTGALGFLSYLSIIILFIIWSVKKLIKDPDKKLETSLLIVAILASYLLYLVQNIFGFSVVVIAMFFFLFPAILFIATESNKELSLENAFFSLPKKIVGFIYRRPIYYKVSLGVVSIIGIYFLYSIITLWRADTKFKNGIDYSNSGNPGRSYNELLDAVELNPNEPLYRNELGYSAANASVSLSDKDATLSATLKSLSLKQTKESLAMSPRNVSLWRTAIRTFYTLSTTDPTYNQKTIDLLNQTIKLAPTDAKLYYNKGLILDELGQQKEAAKAIEDAIKLKPNYRDAHYTLGLIYESLGQKDKAISEMEICLKLIPNEPEAMKKLEELKKL